MKFKGTRGLMINGVVFEEEIFETNDKVLIDRFLNHPGLGMFFSVVSSVIKDADDDEIIESSPDEEVAPEILKAQEMRRLEKRGLELNKFLAKELYVMAKGMGYGGEQLTKQELILWIIKEEEELKKMGEGDTDGC